MNTLQVIITLVAVMGVGTWLTIGLTKLIEMGDRAEDGQDTSHSHHH